MVEDKEIKWEIPKESNEDEEDWEEEESKEDEEETEPELENIIETSTPTFRTNTSQTTPFLEAIEQPIENLEKGLEDTTTTQTQDPEEQTTYAVNAPQYTSSEADYNIRQEAQRQADPEMADMSLMRRETDLSMADTQERRIDFQRWQQTNVERGPEQQEKYIREARRIDEEDKLPFQRKNKRFF